MTKNVTIIREEGTLKETTQKIEELRERFWEINVPDKTNWSNQFVPYARQVLYMLDLAEVIVKAALARKESRGAHYRPDYPERLDQEFLKTTIAQRRTNGQVEISFEEVDTSLIPPRKRDYTKTSFVGKK